MSIWTVLMLVAIIIFFVVPSFKDRSVPVKKLIITPAIFMVLFFEKMLTHFHASLLSWFVVTGLLTGFIAGILIRSKTPVKADHERSLILLKGGYSNLIVFLTIFSVHFVIGYLESVYPGYFSDIGATQSALLFLLAAVSSLTVGGAACLYYKYKLFKKSN